VRDGCVRAGAEARRVSEPLRVLFVCTGNSARSQIAEALLNRKGAGRFVAESAGSRPAARVNPRALAALRAHGIEWRGHEPRDLEAPLREQWDLVITVCDRARESCPYFPGQPATAHWGMPDPAEAAGTDEQQQRAFDDAFRLLNRRIDLLLALPAEKLERLALQQHVRRIAEDAQS
jgi:arsenate reductase